MTKSRTARRMKRLEYYVKREEPDELGHICFYGDTPHGPHRIVLGSANGGSESRIFGMPPGQVAIGSASPGGGKDGVDMRVWFAY